MKKLFKLSICLLIIISLIGCSSKENEDIKVEPTDDNVDVVGGFSISENLPVINDMIFDRAINNYSEILEPICLLATQGASNNYLYLAKTPYAEGTKTTLKVVLITNNDENKPEVLKVKDFELLNYLDGEGSTTPDGLMGGYQDNINLTAFAVDDDQLNTFNQAFEGLTGVGYAPCAVLATQVVAGVNYAYLCLGTSVTQNPITHLYVAKIYKGLDGTVKILNICGLNSSELAD